MFMFQIMLRALFLEEFAGKKNLEEHHIHNVFESTYHKQKRFCSPREGRTDDLGVISTKLCV